MEEDETYRSESIEAFKAIVSALTDSTKDFAEAEFKRIVETEEVKGKVKETMPYIYAAAFLSFAGREINEENLAKVLKVVGISADKKIVKLLFSAKVKCHFPYIYAYYFLLALGKAGSEEQILKIVDSIGLRTDKDRVNDVLNFLSSGR
jgi:ribosomal protein L12E/L44/L45/RPP1/RPP2